MVRGLVKIISPLKEKSKIRVNNRATIDTGVSRCKKFSLNHFSLFAFIIQFKVSKIKLSQNICIEHCYIQHSLLNQEVNKSGLTSF